jgi:hypothetical protein
MRCYAASYSANQARSLGRAPSRRLPPVAGFAQAHSCTWPPWARTRHAMDRGASEGGGLNNSPPGNYPSLGGQKSTLKTGGSCVTPPPKASVSIMSVVTTSVIEST